MPRSPYHLMRHVLEHWPALRTASDAFVVRGPNPVPGFGGTAVCFVQEQGCMMRGTREQQLAQQDLLRDARDIHQVSQMPVKNTIEMRHGCGRVAYKTMQEQENLNHKPRRCCPSC
jgi:hypothetical protein